MSKLQKIRKALFENAEIALVDVKTSKFDMNCNPWSETVDFIVAPKKGVYKAEELQNLMLQLVPGLEASAKDDFRACENVIHFGKLYFDETIGEERTRREIILTDEDIIDKKPKGFENGKKVVEATRTLGRRTWVRLYPNARIALEAAQNGKNEYSIYTDKLRIGERFVRMLHRLGLAS